MPCCSSDGCSSTAVPPDGRYRRILMVALAINLALFLGEVAAGLASGSVSLQADALDFLADSANYAISLFVLTKTLQLRARASLVKGLCMAGFGAWVVGSTVWHALHASLPVASTMGLVGVVALLANGAVFGLLWAYRSGDSNMRSAWICSRNDVLGNLAVLLAALGVFGTGRGWPDITVAGIMAVLALQGAGQVIRHAAAELRRPAANAPASGRSETSTVELGASTLKADRTSTLPH